MDTFPEIGAWYLNTESGEMFEVVALDEKAGEIDMQYFDGALSSTDTESWALMPLAMIPPPEDWSAPYEIEEDEIDESDPQFIPPEENAEVVQ